MPGHDRRAPLCMLQAGDQGPKSTSIVGKWQRHAMDRIFQHTFQLRGQHVCHFMKDDSSRAYYQERYHALIPPQTPASKKKRSNMSIHER